MDEEPRANSAPRNLVGLAARSRALSLGTILLVFAIVVTAIAGFAHVTTQQKSLTAVREESRQIQAILQSVTQADADAMHVLRGDGARLEGFYASLRTLDGLPRGALDRLGGRDTGATPPSELIDELRTVWLDAVVLAAAGNRAAAEEVLTAGETSRLLGAIRASVDAALADADAQFPLHEERITLGTLLVLLLQVSGGTLAILALVYAFRSSAADAAGRAAALETAHAAREQVSRLFEMADVLQSASDHVDANAVLKATAGELVPGYPGALYVFNNSRDRLVLSSAWGREDGAPPLPETINPNACWAVKRGKPHTNEADGGKLCCEHHRVSEAALEIPMIARGEIVGLFQLFASGTGAIERLEQVTDLGSALADGMSLALANMALREKLRNQALRDPLTGLYNRRYMEDSLQRFVRLAERENREISVVMVDLDHFKRLNDERGHAFGDQVLREAAVTLLGNLRETDVVCRYGGEELVVLLPDCPIERAADKAEVLRARIADLSSAHGADISASFGVASVPRTSQSMSDLLAAADAALYKAKQGGRNQVRTAPLRMFRGELEPDLEATPHDDAPRAAAE